MAPNPSCQALAAAQAKTGMSYSAIASKLGKSEQHVVDICTGKTTPTSDEFRSLAQVLGITSPLPSDSAHVAR